MATSVSKRQPASDKVIKATKNKRMFLAFRAEVERLLMDALQNTYGDSALSVLTAHTAPHELERLLEIDIESEHADISSRIAFSLSKILRENPSKISAEIVKNIEIPENSLVSSVKAVGPYINFYASELFFEKSLREILGGICFHRKGRVIIEHTSANPDGPLHIGHLRNACIGDALARILRHAGYDVETQYYVNDMGKQVAILVSGMKYMKIDEKKKIDHAIAEIYVKANKIIEEDEEKMREVEELMRKYEQGDAETVRKYEEVVEKCLNGIRETLHKLGIYHDRFVWESEFVRSSDVSDVVKALERSGRLIVHGNAVLLKMESVDKDLVIKRSDGTSLYSTRDIAYHRWKSERCDFMIDVLGKDHELVAKQLGEALDILGVKRPEILIFEFVSLPEGSLSTRAGRFISVDELIERAVARAYEEVARRRDDIDEERKRKIANIVGIGAMKYDMVRVSPEKNMVFNIEEAIDIEKKGAPFIQYAHARASSILREAEKRGISDDGVNKNDLKNDLKIEHSSERALLMKLAMFDAVILRACDERKPHIVAKYARELAEVFNQFYRDCAVLSARDDIRSSRLLIVKCVRSVLKTSLNLIGIEAPEEM